MTTSTSRQSNASRSGGEVRWCVVSRSAEETRGIAACLARQLSPGAVILLHGILGAGKTYFSQGIAAGLGVRQPVTSPTFTLINEYPVDRNGIERFCHMDLYRTESSAEIADLGLQDYFAGKGVCAVEWADRLGSLAPQERLDVTLECLSDNERQFCIVAWGACSVEALEACASECGG